MCTNYQLMLAAKALAEAFECDQITGVDAPETSIFPKRTAYVVREQGTHILDVMRWGFPPPPTSKAPVVNVRNLNSSFWRATLAKASQRCLVPVTSFSEWEGEKGRKIQRWFNIPSRSVFAFAGIWRPSEDGNVFAFLTCEPNPLVDAFHPKAMPVILHNENYNRWLDGEDAASLALPYPSQLMAMKQ